MTSLRRADLSLENAALRARVAELETENADLRLHAKPLPPRGWLRVKRAAPLTGFSEPEVYRRARTGQLQVIRLGHRIYINPASITPRSR